MVNDIIVQINPRKLTGFLLPVQHCVMRSTSGAFDLKLLTVISFSKIIRGVSYISPNTDPHVYLDRLESL